MPSTSTPIRGSLAPKYSSPVETADGRILPTRGPQVVRWIERNCVFGEGDYLGKPVHLETFQRRFLYRLYEYDPTTGRRRYRRALWGAGKGNGKTPIAAFTAAVELFAPWALGPRIQIGAAALKQANHVFGDLRTTIEESPTLKHLADCYDLQIERRDAKGMAERIAAKEGTNDGPRATCFIADELHEWVGRIGRVFMIAEGAVAKRRNGFSAAFTTAGEDDEDLLLRQLYEYGKRVSSGEIVDDTFLFEWYEADAGLNLDDDDEFELGCRQANPAYDVFVDPASLRWRFHHMPAHEFRRYHLNQFTRPDAGWEVADVWEELAAPKIHLRHGSPAFVGIDVALRHDGAAVVIAQEVGKRLVVKHRIWENPYPAHDSRHDEWRMPMAEIKNELRRIREEYPETARELAGPAFFYDPRFFEDAAQELEGEGLNMIEYPQNDQRMNPASQRFFQMAIDRRLAHDGSADLRRHITNVIPAERNGGWRISKPRGSRKHIDAAVAAAIAVYEATRGVEVEPAPPRPAIY
jgi:phage terminase large subunit-like protein